MDETDETFGDAGRAHVAPAAARPRRLVVLNVFAIAVGAAIGANLRYGVSLWAARQFESDFPYGTMIINIVGSLLIGVLLALFAQRMPVSEPLRLLLITGLLGGFTTFSTFSYEFYNQLVVGNYVGALVYALGSVGGGLLAVAIGVGLVRLLPA